MPVSINEIPCNPCTHVFEMTSSTAQIAYRTISQDAALSQARFPNTKAAIPDASGAWFGEWGVGGSSVGSGVASGSCVEVDSFECSTEGVESVDSAGVDSSGVAGALFNHSPSSATVSSATTLLISASDTANSSSPMSTTSYLMAYTLSFKDTPAKQARPACSMHLGGFHRLRRFLPFRLLLPLF